MAESIQRTLTRVRPPRVRITYDVEIGDAIIKKELPFVLGIMADLSGHAAIPRKKELPPYKERPFVLLDKDNFDAVLADAMPALHLSSGDKLKLDFASLEDFTPARVVKRVEALKKLLDTRNRLQDLAAKLDGNDELHSLIQNFLQENTLQKAIQELQSKQAELRKVVEARKAEAATGKEPADNAESAEKESENTAASDDADAEKGNDNSSEGGAS